MTDWETYVDDCDMNVFKSYVRGVKIVWRMTGKAPVGSTPPSPKAKEWLDEFLDNMQKTKDAGSFMK